MKMTKRCLALVLALLLALGAVGALAAVKIDKTNFPDRAFRKFVKQNFDQNGDGKLTSREMKSVVGMPIQSMGIKDLTGIENFTKLAYLDCDSNLLKKVDLSRNTCLVHVGLGGNKLLTSVKLGRQKRLTNLYVADNPKLRKLDIGGCPILKKKVIKQLDFATKKYAYYGSDGEVREIITDIRLKLLDGSRVLRKYGKPTAIAFNKSTTTVRAGREWFPETDGIWIKMKPATVVYPTRFATSDDDIIALDPVDPYTPYFYVLEPGTVTLTVTSGGKSGTIEVTVE